MPVIDRFSVYLALKHLTEGYESWKFTRRVIGLLKVGQTPSPKPFDTIPLVPEPTAAIGKTLAKVPIFSGLEENELSFLAQRTVLRNYSAGQSVFGEGEPF